MELIAFYAFAAVAIVASLAVVGQRNPMYSVMLLITSFGALAGLYVMLDAPFTAVTQIIIYAGAIMVLFLFVVMLLNASREEPASPVTAGGISPAVLRGGAVLSVLLVFEIIWALWRVGPRWFAPEGASEVSSVTNIGAKLFDTYGYAFAFEATSILILVAMVGAVVLARKER